MLVTTLTAHVPLVLASNAPRDVVVIMLDRLGVRDAFDTIVSAEETPAHRPAPDAHGERDLVAEVLPNGS